MKHQHPDYWTKARRHLAKRDPVLKKLIATYTDATLYSRGMPFHSMMRALVGQQISVKAADSIWARLEALTPRGVTPAAISRLTDEQLRSIGLSARKVEYARTLQQFFMRRNTFAYWSDKEDDHVLEALVALRGVGRWTAEMFLIFCLLRPNVLPVDDLGLLKAIGKHYHDAERHPTKDELLAYRERWHPYNSVATWYLWRSLDPVVVVY